jgi:hypothetical protein
MKKTAMIACFFLGTIFTACKKEVPPSPITSYQEEECETKSNENNFVFECITIPFEKLKDSTSDGIPEHLQLSYFSYTGFNITKIKHKFGNNAACTLFDTLYYDENGRKIKIETYDTKETMVGTTQYHYTDGLITKIEETGINNFGEYSKISYYHYTNNDTNQAYGSVLSSQTVVYTKGQKGNTTTVTIDNLGTPLNFLSTTFDNIKNITYQNNDIVAATIDGIGQVNFVNATIDDSYSSFKGYLASNGTTAVVDIKYNYRGEYTNYLTKPITNKFSNFRGL